MADVQCFARKLFYLPDSRNRALIENETRALRKLCNGTHPNLIVVLNMDRFRFSPLYFIDMELCDLSLHDYLYPTSELNYSAIGLPPFIKTLPPSGKSLHIWNIMKQIVAGVEFIHSHDEVHRDLKPRNSGLLGYSY